MNIEDLTLKQIREIGALVGHGVASDDSAWDVGSIYHAYPVNAHSR